MGFTLHDDHGQPDPPESPGHGDTTPDAPAHPDPPLGQRTARSDTSWVDPDPPPIPDRIRKKVDPRLPTLPTIPKVAVKVDHRWLKRGAAAAGVALIALAGLLLWPRGGFDQTDRARWEQLCDDYAAWYGPLIASVSHQDRLAFESLDLSHVLVDVDAAEAYDPRTIAGSPDATLEQLRTNPPTSAQTAEAREATRRAEAGIKRVAEAFERWPVAVSLREHHVLLATHGWDRAADAVEQALAEAPPRGSGAPGQRLHRLTRLNTQTGAIAELCADLEVDLAALADRDDPVFDLLAQTVRGLDHPEAPPADGGGNARLAALADQLGPLESFARRFRDLVEQGRWEQINHENFRAHGRAYAMLAQGGHEPTDVFRVWLDETDTYLKLGDDWRLAWAGLQQGTLNQLGARAAELKAADHPRADAFARQITRIHGRVDALLDRPFIAGEAAEFQIERDVLEREILALSRAVELSTKQAAASDTIASLRDDGAGLGQTAYRSDAVDQHWRVARQRLADRLEAGDEPEAIEAEVAAVRSQLLALIDPVSPRALAAPVAFDTSGDDETTARFLDALAADSADGREDLLRRILKNGLPIDESRWSAVPGRYDGRLDAARAMAQTARDVQRALSGAYPLDDPAVAGDEPLNQRVAGWADSELWHSPAVAEAGAPVVQRLEALAAIGGLEDRNTLSGLALESNEPAFAIAAWRQMGRLASPGTADALRREAEIQTRLLPLGAALADRDRAESLIDEIAAARPGRWQAAMASAQTDAEIAAIAAQADAWGVETDALPAATRFNLVLHHAKAALASIADGPERDGQVLALAEAFVASGAPMNDDPRIAEALDALSAITAQGAAHRERLAEAGPAGVGWDLLPGDNPRVVRFGREGWELVFVRIDPVRGESFYLCTTELPVGLALDAVAWAKAENELIVAMPKRGDEDTRKGPRSWAYHKPTRHGHALRTNPDGWLDRAAAYPESLTPTPPGPRSPINYVPAEAAVYLAGRLGCRLPTATEWQTALERHPLPAGALPNLRDTTWSRHAEHVAGLIGAGVPDAHWANSDVFRPAGMPPGDPAGDYHPTNDAVLWFTPVDDTARPTHLVGNLAELVTTVPIDPRALLDDATSMAERRDAFRREHKDSFAVLGGSALSPASLRPDQPQPVNVFGGARGYADVGLRLAFVAPQVSPARQAERLLEQLAFIRDE